MDTSWLSTTYNLAMCAICKELVLRISGSPQRKKFLDNRTKNVYFSGVLRGKERKWTNMPDVCTERNP